jgi:hypothetical protein
MNILFGMHWFFLLSYILINFAFACISYFNFSAKCDITLYF